MKKIIIALAAAVLAATSCGVLGSSSSSANAEQSNGQAAGVAIKQLYSQYQADGNKVNLNNVSTLLTLASLSQSISDVKSYEKGSGKYLDFAKGLILGSSGLVTEQKADNTMSQLSALSSLINPDQIAKAAAAASEQAKAQQAAQQAQQTAQQTAQTVATQAQNAVSALSNASSIASQVGGLLSLFK